MVRLLSMILLLLSLGLADQKKIITTRILTDDSRKGTVELEATVEDNHLKLKVEKDGETKNFEADLDDQKALKALDDMLEDMDIDVDINSLVGKQTVNTGAFLGVRVQKLTEQLRRYFGVSKNTGVLITEVVEDSPAEESGLQAGDIIIKIGKKRIEKPSDLTKAIREYDPGTKVQITVIRDEHKKKFKVTLGETEFPFLAQFDDFTPDWFLNRFPDLPFKGYFHYNNDDEDWDYIPGPMLPDSELQKELDDIRNELQSLRKEFDELRQP
ncbi:MAG: PDZ domain-containing protein [FCB group bacterium]|nr:PDZ domain-containing protein [FCB group bacterium]